MGQEPTNLSVANCAETLRATSRSDLVTFLSAPPALAAGFWLAHRLEGRIPPGLLPCLLLLLLACVSATVAARRADASELPPTAVPAAATRLGARAGLMAFLLGGGACMIGRTLRQAMIESDPPRQAWLHSSLPSTAAVLFALLPAIALGSLSSVLALASRPAGAAVPVRRHGTRRRFGVAVPLGLAVFASGLLAPTVAGVLKARSRPQPLMPGMQGHGQAPKLPQIPDGLDTAGAARWRIAASLPVPGLAAGAVAAYSPDSRLLAYSAARVVVVRDLRLSAQTARFAVPSHIESLAWSPSADRLLCRCSGDSLLVLEPASGTRVELPIRSPLPAGWMRWSSSNEADFYQGWFRSGTLNLNTLRVRHVPVPASDIDGARRSFLAETSRCRLVIRPRIRSVTAPSDTADCDWHFVADAALFVEDRDTGASHALGGVEIRQDDTVLVSPDLSLVTVASSGAATVHHVGLSDTDPAGPAATLPPVPDHAPRSPLAALASTGRVAAFVCAPLVNPLNGSVVGPDGRQVRALAMCEQWDEGGTLRIAETYGSIGEGDVAGYLHHWPKGDPVQLVGAGLEDWWARCDAPATTGKVSTAARWRQADLAATACGIQFRGWRSGDIPAGRRTTLEDLTALALAPQPNPSSTAERVAPAAGIPASSIEPPAPSPEARIEAFVRAHHAKAEKGDAAGFAADYAEEVELSGRGRVDPDFIRRDQAAYHSRYERVSETVEGRVAVEWTPVGWSASYVIRSLAAKRSDGTEFDRRVRITLRLREAGDGYAILREQAGDAE